MQLVGRHSIGAVTESLHLIQRHQAESKGGREGSSETEAEDMCIMAWAIKTSKPTLSDTPSNKATFPNSFKRVLPTGFQAFTGRSLWGPFSFR